MYKAVADLLKKQIHAGVPTRALPRNTAWTLSFAAIVRSRAEFEQAAQFQQVCGVGDAQRLAGILFRHQHGDAHGVDLARQREDVAHHDRRKAERGLVHQQQPGAADQRAGDRHHLLLAAAERPGELPLPFAQARKAVEHLVDAAIRPAPCRGDLEAAPMRRLSSTVMVFHS